MSVLLDPTARYGALESFVYDRCIAPAVIDLADRIEHRLLGQVPEGAKILEVGSGGGQLAVRLAEKRRDVSIVGLDLAPEQVARAAERAHSLASRVRFVEGTAMALPFDDGTFDAVLSVASIKHWPDPAQGLAECARVLRAGGSLAVIEADRGCAMRDAKAFVERFRIPALLRPAALVGFRTFVAGNAFDLDEMRGLSSSLGPGDWKVERIEDTPGLVILGTKDPNA